MNRQPAIMMIPVFLMLLTPTIVAQPIPGSAQPANALQELSANFWEWRAAEQPFSFDDIPRLDRPRGWAADWSPSTIAKHRDELTAFENRWKELGKDVRDRSRPETVDYLLVGSAIARARWELDYVRGWQRNPWFYLDQTLASLFVSLTQPPPFDETRSAEIRWPRTSHSADPRRRRSQPQRSGRPAGPVIHSSTAGHWSSPGRDGARAQALSHAGNRIPTGSRGASRHPRVGRISGMAAAATAGYAQQRGGRTRQLHFLPEACGSDSLLARAVDCQWTSGMGTGGCLRVLRKKSQCQAAAIGPGQRPGNADRHREKTRTGNPRFSRREKYPHRPRLGTALSQSSLPRLSRAAGCFRGGRRSHRTRAAEGQRHQLHQDAFA